MSGWTYTRNRHGKLRPPTGGGYVTIAVTPSDDRALLNVRRLAKAVHLDIRPLLAA